MDCSLQTLFKVITKIKEETANKWATLTSPSICLVGPTGAGKSSFIAYQMNSSEMVCKKGSGFGFNISSKSGTGYPSIGNGNKSETEVPGYYKKGNMNFIDFPGINETKSDFQEIVNAWSTSQVFKKGLNFRLVITLEESSLITQRGNDLADLISRL